MGYEKVRDKAQPLAQESISRHVYGADVAIEILPCLLRVNYGWAEFEPMAAGPSHLISFIRRFWQCPNGKECKYRHALPPGFVLKSQMKVRIEEALVMGVRSEVSDEGAHRRGSCVGGSCSLASIPRQFSRGAQFGKT